MDRKKPQSTLPVFSRDDVIIENQETVFDGFFKIKAVSLRHRLFGGGWSPTIQREIFHRGDAAAAILFDPTTQSIGLIDQFRAGALNDTVSPWCLEVVAGMVEPEERIEDLIRRELQEEAGISNLTLIPITSYYSTPGGCSEMIHLFCAICDLSQAGGIHGLDSENEDILLRVYPAEEVFNDMLDSRMNNAATLIALQWLEKHALSLKPL